MAFSTPRGSTPFPSLLYEGDAGSFGTYRNEVQLGGTVRKFDYYGAFADFQTRNSIPMDEYHNITSVANLGYSLTQRHIHSRHRAQCRYRHRPARRLCLQRHRQRRQAVRSGHLSCPEPSTTTSATPGTRLVRYGMARKREESTQWYPAGNLIDGNYFGNFVTITGANGFSTAGQALMNYGGIYPYTIDLVSNRDNLYAQTDYSITPHLAIVGGFRFENERGAENEWVYDFSETLERTNYDYMLEINGDFKQRLFYSLGGGIQKNQLYGTEGTPRIGVAYYAVRPGKGIFHGTKINFNFAKGVQRAYHR